MKYCYLNGRFVQRENAKISIQDRGFRFGDGVFETIAVYNGLPYQWELHMERLQAGLHALEIPADLRPLRQASLRLISKNDLNHATLRIAISRGIGSEGYLPAGPASATTIVIEATARHLPAPDPARLWLSSYEKISPRALPVAYKLAQGVNATLARLEAAKHGCLDGLQLNSAGEICEVSSGNIFWKQNNILYTPALSCGILTGTTRAAIIRLSPMEVREGHFTRHDLAKADAVVVTNTHWQAMPVTEIQPIAMQFSASVELAELLRDALTHDIAHDAKHHHH